MFSISISYQQAQDDLGSLLDQIEKDNSMGVITRQGHKDIALLPAEELASLLETLYLLRSPTNAKRLFEVLERSHHRDNESQESETISRLCLELEIEREK
jgi:antitoxin YefM